MLCGKRDSIRKCISRKCTFWKCMFRKCILRDTLITSLAIENNNLIIHSDSLIKSERDTIRNSCDFFFFFKNLIKFQKSKNSVMVFSQSVFSEKVFQQFKIWFFLTIQTKSNFQKINFFQKYDIFPKNLSFFFKNLKQCKNPKFPKVYFPKVYFPKGYFWKVYLPKSKI